MKVKVYGIFDDKAAAYSNPFFMIHHGQALRAFGDVVQDPNSSIHRHPSDFHLYYIGDFDNESGQFTSFEPQFLGHAVDFLNVKPLEKPVEVLDEKPN